MNAAKWLFWMQLIMKKAKEVFLKKYDNELDTLRKRINLYEKLKSAVEDYKEDTKC